MRPQRTKVRRRRTSGGKGSLLAALALLLLASYGLYSHVSQRVLARSSERAAVRFRQLHDRWSRVSVLDVDLDCPGVRVEVTQAGDADGRLLLRFEVIDSGPGIPPEAQHRLFQEFTQVDQLATRRAGGTGLGLAICRKIVTAMRGEIGVHSTVGRGSTFWFTMALAPAQGHVVAETAGGEPEVSPLKVLVAEDNPVNQQVALGLLRRRGHRVDIVATGRAAVEAVASRAYDVVLMDVHMPEMDGIEVTREIRRLPGEKGRVPIIALSASGDGPYGFSFELNRTTGDADPDSLLYRRFRRRCRNRSFPV